MPDATSQHAHVGRQRRFRARKTLREGYLRFDGRLVETDGGVVVQRPETVKPVPMYERSEVYGTRQARRRAPRQVAAESSQPTRLDNTVVAPLQPKQPRRSNRPPKHLVSKRQREGRTSPAGTAGEPVVFTARNAASVSLDGSSVPRHRRPEVGEVSQWSGTILRIFDTTATGSTRHRVKFRLLTFYDGREVVRYSLFRDHDSARGFDGNSNFELSMHQAQILSANGERAAEVHLRYDGQVTIEGKGTAVFDGMIIVRGDGHVVCTDPSIISGTGKGAVLRNAATVGWW